MYIKSLMEEIAAALPHTSCQGRKTLREVCLTFNYIRNHWDVIAGGHPAVHIGEYGGDFQGEGDTAEEALIDCLHKIRNA